MELATEALGEFQVDILFPYEQDQDSVGDKIVFVLRVWTVIYNFFVNDCRQWLAQMSEDLFGMPLAHSSAESIPCLILSGSKTGGVETPSPVYVPRGMLGSVHQPRIFCEMYDWFDVGPERDEEAFEGVHVLFMQPLCFVLVRLGVIPSPSLLQKWLERVGSHEELIGDLSARHLHLPLLCLCPETNGCQVKSGERDESAWSPSADPHVPPWKVT